MGENNDFKNIDSINQLNTKLKENVKINEKNKHKSKRRKC